MNQNNNLAKVGAMWRKKTKKGEDFFSLDIGRERFVAFKNGFKKKDNHPEYVVYSGAEFKSAGS